MFFRRTPTISSSSTSPKRPNRGAHTDKMMKQDDNVDAFSDEEESYVSVAVDEPDEGEDDGETDPSSSTGDGDAKKTTKEPLMESESVVVHQAEVITFVLLLYSAAGLGVAVRLLTKEEATKDYEAAFEVNANNIVDVTKSRITEAGALLDTLSASFQSFSETNDGSSKFTTMPNFVSRTEPTLLATNASMISWCPIVPTSEVAAWNAYSESNMWWASEESTGGSVEWMPLDPSGTSFQGSYAPQWQFAPLQQGQLNKNRFDESDDFTAAFERVQETGKDALTKSYMETNKPTASLLAPTRTLKNSTDVTGVLQLRLVWENLLSDALPPDLKQLVVVVSDTCGGENIFKVTGKNAAFYRSGGVSKKDPYKDKTVSSPVANFGSACQHTITVHATAEFEEDYDNKEGAVYLILVMVVFLVMIIAFLIYAWTVRSRQKTVMGTVQKTQQIVSSIFPENVQDRIFDEAKTQMKQEKKASMGPMSSALQKMVGNTDDANKQQGKPIADLFTDCTIMFADIVGFTAWSSTREPSQVFTLLETIYHHFDEVAARRRVFKVETVGDCYVAVAGLPEPRKDHAVAMARFSFDCLNRFNRLTRQLVLELGPDTEDLMIRIGLHSGPVTAGVLRGERARFQLFGDTVNTTARMESTGMPNAIQVSPETGKLLTDAGKSQWLQQRQDRVVAKGKGEMETFWLNLDMGPEAARPLSDKSSDTGSVLKAAGKKAGDLELSDSEENVLEKESRIREQTQQEHNKHLRLVAWNVDVLAKSLMQVIDRRNATESPMVKHLKDRKKMRDLELKISENRLVLNEVKEIVKLPGFKGKTADIPSPTEPEKLPSNVKEQLQNYVQALAAMYNDNPFHNFEHASHVTMSVCKLLSRIVAPDHAKASNEESLHDHTYGITSDPLTQFAVILSALIHDADHPGIPNSQLIKEEAPLAAVYEKSVAEQNSVDLAWQLLMEKEYEDLRGAIYSNESELKRFRQLIVNVVMATDIMDKELKALRNKRWELAFSPEAPANANCSEREAVNRKATIVLEHLIQASDVAHTMQHWHVYKKWNTRLFLEVYKAYKEGRAEKDPSENWYRGEIGFFDFYIIPLAKKLKDCGVFGVSSDEYLNYAIQNRAEWERKGQMIVAEYVDTAKREGANWGINNDTM